MSDSQTLISPEPSPIAPAAYTVPDIARLAQSSERHVWRLIDQGLVPGRIKGLGRLVRFSRAVVDAWLAGDRTAGRN
jgi:predicted DNA-binding transcriptional regulator AlpA